MELEPSLIQILTAVPRAARVIVYATEQVPQATMMRCGLVLNLACIAVITAMAPWPSHD